MTLAHDDIALTPLPRAPACGRTASCAAHRRRRCAVRGGCARSVRRQQLSSAAAHHGGRSMRSRCSGSTFSPATTVRFRSATARSTPSAPTRPRSCSSAPAFPIGRRSRSRARSASSSAFCSACRRCGSKAIYLALSTFALAMATPQLLKFRALEKWTGGVQGTFVPTFDAPFGLPLAWDQWLYLLCARHCGGDVPARVEPAARRDRPRHRRDPRSSDRGREHGHQHLALQIADLRRQRHVHRHRRRARRAGGAIRRRPTAFRFFCRSACWSAA